MTTIRIRAHRGTLAEAMKTSRTITATKEAVRDYFREVCAQMPYEEADLAALQVLPYSGPDTRIGWKATYLVKIGLYPAGFTDGPVVD